MELVLKQRSVQELDAKPVTTEALTPKEFIHLAKERKKNIVRVTIESPALGKSGFGRILVHYDKPIYKVK